MQDNPTTTPAAYDSPDFGTLRTIDRDGDTLFCAKDAAKALGYRNASKAVGDHCKGITFRYPLPTKGGTSIVRSTVKVTGKGQQYFVARYCGREA